MIILKITALCFMGVLISRIPCSAQASWVKEVLRKNQNITVHEEATAVVLHSVSDIEVKEKGKAEIKNRIVNKILSKEGVDFSTLMIRDEFFLKIKGLKGWLIKTDGTAKSLKDENIVTVSAHEGAGYYDESQIVIATFPDVDPGDIVAFEYSVVEKGWTSFYQPFLFQIQQPVRYSRFSISIPKDWEMNIAEWRIDDVLFERQDQLYIWTARDLNYQPEEPMAPSWDYLSRKIAVTCFDPDGGGIDYFADWPSVADWMVDTYSEPVQPTQGVVDLANELTEGLSTFQEKIQVIATHVQDKVRYVAMEIGKGWWKPRHAQTTLLNLYGDCKDKTTLMMAMLDAVDIHAVPVLANTSLPIDPRLPTLFQFNHVIVGIQIDEENLSPKMKQATLGNWLLFDPTDPAATIGQLPWSLRGNHVLLGIPEDSVLLEIPYPNPWDYKLVFIADAVIDSDGSFTAEVTSKDFGGFAAVFRYIHRIKTEKKQIELWRSVMSEMIPGVKLTNYRTGGKADSTWVSFTIHSENYIKKTGDFFLLRPNIFMAEEAPILTAEKRHHSIWFGPPVEYETQVSWRLPVHWIADIDTTTRENHCETAYFYSKMKQSENKFGIHTIVRNNGWIIGADAYDSAQLYERDLCALKGQMIIVHKP
jgi:transglutaminase-like putative cysteine protease